MRSAERLRTVWLALACGLSAAGCSSLPWGNGENVNPPIGSTAASKQAATARPVAPTAAQPQAVSDPEVVVTPAAQKAFDDARRAMRAGRMDEAERGFKSVVQFHPELGGPHANLGVIYRQANKLPQSATELELAVKASPRQPLYFNQLGITYRQQGQFTKAREAYERAIELDPNYAAATLNLGILSDLYLWDSKRALELYDRYLVLTPAGDANVTKWVADLKNRTKAAAAAAPAAAPARKEKE
ncbi:tetratricopeptide repeat protein [Sphaerotilaceae bacterium SBD11-9]